ncbi:MAG: phage holin family protein [Burkholderiales bacterium]|nr:phage holin family protein [Burkholderiales bacterium]
MEAPGFQSQGLVHSLKNLGKTGVAILYTRLQLVSNEIQEEKGRLIELMVYAVVGVFCASFGVLLLTFFIVVAFWDTNRLAVLAVMTLLYLSLAAAAIIAFRNKLKAHAAVFAATLTELKKDHINLSA